MTTYIAGVNVYLSQFQLVKRSEKRVEAQKSLAEAQENGTFINVSHIKK